MKTPTYRIPAGARTEFLKTGAPRELLVLNIALALVYFAVLLLVFPHGNTLLFWLLIIGEVFHLWQVVTFIYTVWDTSYQAPKKRLFYPPVDVFITVAGEPTPIVEETVRAAAAMRYSDKRVYILNDGYVAKKDTWHEMEELAQRLHAEGLPVYCITRTVGGGAKAGNINHALAQTDAPLVAIFDADHVPHEDFLVKTAPYFGAVGVGFVQTPQFYKNFTANYLTQSSWEQQELFFGPICKGKNRLNATTMCGTNMLISRKALEAVGGMCTESIAEDFVTGLFMHARGYRSVYVGEVLAEGLAAEDFLSYSKQQFRWARGALDVIFRYNPLFMRGLTFAQRIQYLASASFYLTGVVVLIDISLPLAYFFTGLVPIQVSGMLLAAAFLPYMFFTLYCLQRVTNFTFTFPSLALSMSSFTIHLRALFAAATFRKSAFSITPKESQSGNYIRLTTVHIIYIILTLVGFIVALMREEVSASLVNNLAWAILNIAVFVPFIKASLGTTRTIVPLKKPRIQAAPPPLYEQRI
jgi:cellulose synthase (UDP-forming)